MDYEFENFISIIKRAATIEFIMTKNICFFEDIKDVKEKIKFCQDRDISTLPSKDNIHLYKLKNNIFLKTKIKQKDKLKITDFIFDNDVLSSFENGFIKYVYDNNDLVGILHFSDYNRKTVYIYLYGLINEFEENLRDVLIKNNYTEEDFLNYHKSKKTKEDYDKLIERYEKDKIKLKDFQFANLFELIIFCNSKLKLKLNDKISQLRNDVAHIRRLIKTKDKFDKEESFDYNSFKRFTHLLDELLNSNKLLDLSKNQKNKLR